MAGYKSHIIAYLVLACAATYALKEYPVLELSALSLLAALFIGCVYSILPDIDAPSSIIRRAAERLSLALIVALSVAYVFFREMILIYAGIAVASCLLILWFLKHRGFFHTVLAGALLSIPWALADPVYSVYAFLGYAAHLLADGGIKRLF